MAKYDIDEDGVIGEEEFVKIVEEHMEARYDNVVSLIADLELTHGLLRGDEKPKKNRSIFSKLFASGSKLFPNVCQFLVDTLLFLLLNDKRFQEIIVLDMNQVFYNPTQLHHAKPKPRNGPLRQSIHQGSLSLGPPLKKVDLVSDISYLGFGISEIRNEIL